MRRPAPDPIYSLRGSSSALSFLKFQGNETLYSGNYDGAVFEWSMETRRVVSNFSAHPGHSILYLDFSNDSHLITHGRDGLVKIWAKNETGMRQNGELKCSDTGFCGSCLLADGTLAVPGFNQSEVDVYDLNTVKVISQLKHDNSNKKCGTYGGIQRTVLDTRYMKEATIGKSSSDDVQYKTRRHQEEGMCMKIKRFEDCEKRELLTGYEDGSVALWDLRQNKIVDKLNVHTDPVMCMDFCSVLNKGYSGSVTDDLYSWTLFGDKINLSVSVKTKNPGFNDILVRKDGKMVVFAGWDESVRIFGAKKLKPLAVLNYHKESVYCLAFSEDNILACGSKDKQITLWDIYR